MTRNHLALLVALVVGSSAAMAQDQGSTLVAQQKRRAIRTARPTSSPTPGRPQAVGSELADALRLAKTGNYPDATLRFFQLSQNPRYREKRLQIKYMLGLMLYQMKLNQLSAFQFISVIKAGKSEYLKQSLEKLSLAADQLDDDTLLNYAISKVEVDEFPRTHRDMLYYRVGEFQMRNGQLESAASSFSRVSPESPLYKNAKYQEGLAQSELKANSKAYRAFEDLFDSRRGSGVTDPARVAAIMAKARVYYQGKQWDDAIESYREIPRDTTLWHDMLFESSWAMLRSGRFRSAISNFQSMHSAFYEDHYLPESLLLRSIVYLYICKYDEMEKVLNLFNRIYQPTYRGINNYLKNVSDPVTYYNEVFRINKEFADKGDAVDRSSFKMPFLVGRKLSKEGDVRRSSAYIRKLADEIARIDGMQASWSNSALGRYGKKILQNRLLRARAKAGRQIRAHMIATKDELFDLMEQEGFVRYEMINSKKETLKKRVAGKSLEEGKSVEADTARDYYVQNGYEYYPFRGEYWLDELGNYHYVGTQSCE